MNRQERVALVDHFSRHIAAHGIGAYRARYKDILRTATYHGTQRHHALNQLVTALRADESLTNVFRAHAADCSAAHVANCSGAAACPPTCPPTCEAQAVRSLKQAFESHALYHRMMDEGNRHIDAYELNLEILRALLERRGLGADVHKAAKVGQHRLETSLDTVYGMHRLSREEALIGLKTHHKNRALERR